MVADHVCRRVLLAAAGPQQALLRRLFEHEPLRGWEVCEAASLEQARFVVQHAGCDALVLDEGLWGREPLEGLDRLTARREVPVVLLADPDPRRVAEALAGGVGQWLPRDLALHHPPVVAAALAAGARPAAQPGLPGEALRGCRRQVRRLLDLLWEVSPMDPHTRWLTQRHVLERLAEEVARAERYGTPLSVVLGELCPPRGEDGEGGPPATGWLAQRLGRAKRRADVAGHYGPNGFLLLLSQTPESGAAACCRRLRDVLRDSGDRTAVHAFFGVAAYSADKPSLQSLLSRAEKRLEQAKTAEQVGPV